MNRDQLRRLDQLERDQANADRPQRSIDALADAKALIAESGVIDDVVPLMDTMRSRWGPGTGDTAFLRAYLGLPR